MPSGNCRPGASFIRAMFIVLRRLGNHHLGRVQAAGVQVGTNCAGNTRTLDLPPSVFYLLRARTASTTPVRLKPRPIVIQISTITSRSRGWDSITGKLKVWSA